MKLKSVISTCLAAATLIAGVVAPVPAQTEKPTESRLLNGLRLLVFKAPAAEKISVSIRLHSGAAFDPRGKEGTMCLLSKALFPNQELADFYREDLGGSFRIVCNYDYMQVDATAKTDKLIEMLEPIAAAIGEPQLNKDLTARVKAPVTEFTSRIETDRGYLATTAAARNLVGDFPYGRPMEGSVASLAKIDFADLMQAEERFITSDNATIAVRGNVEPLFVSKVVKRLFGSWIKSDKRVPLTFAQPDAPKQAIVTQPLAQITEGTLEIRTAVRGFARNDVRYHAFMVLEKILRARLAERYSGNFAFWMSGVSMPPVIVFGPAEADAESLRNENPIGLLQPEITEAEFARAKDIVSKQIGDIGVAQLWLDCETYKLESPDGELAKMRNVTLADVRAALAALRTATAATTVFTASTAQSSTIK